jgi:hypothetical protein
MSERSELAADPAIRRRRWPIVVGVVAVLVAVGAIVWARLPRPVCSEDERAALLAVPVFEGAEPPVVDSGPETQPSTAGCEVSYTAHAPAEEVARYYFEQLEDLGWSTPLPRPIEGNPFRIWVQADAADLEAHPDWEDLHFGVTVTVLTGRVNVDVSVRRYIVTVF